jgi:hypothetical protein
MKNLVIIVVFLFTLNSHAQTGIGTTTPNASAKLDVYATNKGFLPPRVTLTSVTDATTIASPAEGLLVYNLGSVGLQAGYYYWNGANWATIATATSAGNGVTASDMVKLYDGVGNAATINSTGVTFSVTTSGKYLFDYSTSATCGNCTLTLNFQVRDGANSNAVIASDMQTSYSNNIHAEYNGKVEANLIAGRSYNVLVTASSGGIYSNDYTRVYMKQVSGNLPVTGQTVDYVNVTRTTNQTVNTSNTIIFDTKNAGNIPYDPATGNFTLTAGKTYKLEAFIGLVNTNTAGAEVDFVWRTAAGVNLGNAGQILSANFSGSANSGGVSQVIYTPTSNTTVSLYTLWSSSNAIISGGLVYATIEQIGSSAIINPWTLSGTNTYNTTGNVGIGTNAPTEKLEVSGNVKATNFLGTATAALSAPTNITYGEIDVPQNLSVGSGFVDLVNIPLPSAGKYKITYVIRASVSTNATLAVVLLRNSSNAQVSGTEAMPVYNMSNVQVTCTQVSVVTTTAAETYKLSTWTQTGAGIINVINDGNGRSKVLWEKIQ